MNNKFNVHTTDIALDDLLQIFSYISINSVEIAEKIINDIDNRIQTLKEFPFRGRVVPELLELKVTQYREIIEQRWRIIYRIKENDVYIVSIIDQKRNASDILSERLEIKERKLKEAGLKKRDSRHSI